MLFPAASIVQADATTTPDVATSTPLTTDTPPPQTQVATSTDGTGGVASTIGGTILTGNATASSTVTNGLNIGSTSPVVGGRSRNR